MNESPILVTETLKTSAKMSFLCCNPYEELIIFKVMEMSCEVQHSSFLGSCPE